MALVPEDEAPAPSEAQHGHQEQPTLRDYAPLAVIFALLLAATLALSWRDATTGALSLAAAIRYFMAGFFLVFAGFKLLDLPGFAQGYSTYDLLAQRVFAYGYVYPFIELAFGLTMLVGIHPPWLLVTEAAVMVFSGIGVVLKLAKREKFTCACLGTIFKLPLTKITLVEDFGMAALAVALLLLV